MTEINPNNYVGAELTLVGYAAGDPRNPAYDKNGERGLKEFSIALNEGYKKDGEFIKTGTTWYTYVATQDWFDRSGLRVGKGDKVRIDGARQEVRSYEAKDGTSKLGITLRFGNVTVLEAAQSDEDPAF